MYMYRFRYICVCVYRYIYLYICIYPCTGAVLKASAAGEWPLAAAHLLLVHVAVGERAHLGLARRTGPHTNQRGLPAVSNNGFSFKSSVACSEFFRFHG